MGKVIFILLLLSFKLNSLEDYIQISNTVKLDGYTITIIVDSDSDKTEWNSYTHFKTEEFLKALEIYLKAKFPGPDSFIIKGREEIYYEDPNSENYGKRVGGANFWDYIGIEYDISKVGSPALLLHEVAHYYFGYPSDTSDYKISWLIEGLVSYLPIAMADSGKLNLSDDEYSSIFKHWGFYNSDIDKELPLINDFRWESSDLFSRFYMKSFKLIHILYKELGSKNFRNFAIDLYQQSELIKDMDDLIKLLSKYKSIDWNNIFSGWVFNGNFIIEELTEFIDSDSDTILNIDESYLGTNPYNSDSDGDLLPDNYEIENGFDPLKSISEKKAIEIIKENGPFIDGEGSDWKYVDVEILRNGNNSSSNYKIKDIQSIIKNDKLFVKVTIDIPDTLNKDVMFDILIDSDGDKSHDYEVAYMLHNKNYHWIYYIDENRFENNNKIILKSGDIIEVEIPLSLIPNKKISLLPIIRDIKKNINYDELSKWYIVE